MSNKEFLRSQNNEIFRLIEKAGLTPSEFEWQEYSTTFPSFTYPKLAHLPTGFYFIFNIMPLSGKPQSYYFPSPNKLAETRAETNNDWDATISILKDWLTIVSREHFEPDLWSTTNNKALVAAELAEFENTPFSTDEQARISKAIGELKSFLLSSQNHSQEHIQFIEERLSHLEESSRRLGRKDWVTLAMGTLTNIIVGVALAPDAAREFIRNAGLLLGWVMGNIPLLH